MAIDPMSFDTMYKEYFPVLSAEEMATRAQWPPFVYEPPTRWERFKYQAGRPWRFIQRLLRKAGGCTCDEDY